ncbi:MAG: hypothetical protein A3C02_01265 [Candidatus Andersenbacteria bacterium RIFCSPHIGHO2_02_FULL_45_11]|uniref:Uncharacterized protein n=1 Tax=Candidatus Andersenbacteria bacterium RIFCSPHIGHO2_12_FULL_45_11 TaxID=1797281 RepID=A0A1G1X325_9BACT|nr:MAG: hypothetical protein A2805_00045 [Candidatus Andersenbacteria bacterium RIFCSPHIGHO2_01_FULL_46_36]OGY34354.1 MAG: hypothetical protein A3D99_02475 [Candidatus Andersenbacteria bacterium RIFCSPHIGHO2_12_FULL_45_11]OGY34933.1 MAG: hypothetical protein A3C02_01265 [Candidatus Andersenbacteria bacterium RIFCSPHIGHO2_02_FULL_45_11]
MLVDKILEWYGRNPEVYPSSGDKWVVASSEIFVSSFIYFPIFFGLLPLVYLYIKRKNYKKDKKKFIAKIILYPIAGAIGGVIILSVLLGIVASMGAKSFYEG